MKKLGIKTYIGAWAVYLLFAFLAFPQLLITVMLFSIPLTMLGGWIYLYKGALLTTALTIPIHFLLLSVYSDDPALIKEAFNPFGIGSQLIFSCCAALLRATQLEYRRLNESLEEIVLERTEDLEKLTHYLINAQELESRELNASLLEQPYKNLKSMLATSQLLKHKLEVSNHPRAADAANIATIISSCIQQLRAMDKNTLNSMPHGDDLLTSLKNLKEQSEQLYDVRIALESDANWGKIDTTKVRFLSEIIFEAVTNALRHAGSKQIVIGMEEHKGSLDVFIENDGAPYAASTKEGMGLPLMRFRASKIGAELSIGPSEQLSTQVTCRFPSPNGE